MLFHEYPSAPSVSPARSIHDQDYGSKRNLDLSLPEWFPPRLCPLASFTTFSASRCWSRPGMDVPLKLLTKILCVSPQEKKRKQG